MQGIAFFFYWICPAIGHNLVTIINMVKFRLFKLHPAHSFSLARVTCLPDLTFTF